MGKDSRIRAKLEGMTWISSTLTWKCGAQPQKPEGADPDDRGPQEPGARSGESGLQIILFVIGGSCVSKDSGFGTERSISDHRDDGIGKLLCRGHMYRQKA